MEREELFEKYKRIGTEAEYTQTENKGGFIMLNVVDETVKYLAYDESYKTIATYKKIKGKDLYREVLS